MSKGGFVIVSFHHDPVGRSRSSFVQDAIKRAGIADEVVILAANFRHIGKQFIKGEEVGVRRIPVRSYRSNISIKRILSYLDFGRSLSVDRTVVGARLLYLCVPDYISAAILVSGAKRRGQSVVVDVVDLWPEAFPLPRLIDSIVKGVLRLPCARVRSRMFADADLIFFQSEYFAMRFGATNVKRSVLKMCASSVEGVLSMRTWSSLQMEFRIIFLGSVNSITDASGLVRILSVLSARKRVYFTLIGGGESAESLLDALRASGVVVVSHGVSFDHALIAREMLSADFGFNGYKNSTEVAVSYKSIDYLRYGVPLINSAKGDSRALVERHKCGINYDTTAPEAAAFRMLEIQDSEHAEMVRSSIQVFERDFSVRAFSGRIVDDLKQVLSGKAKGSMDSVIV